jgi:hypothetical protein
MCVCVCIYIYACVYVCVYVHICMCMCVCVYVCVDMREGRVPVQTPTENVLMEHKQGFNRGSFLWIL